MAPDTHDDRAARLTPLAWGALMVVYVVWGSTYLGIAIAIETFPPLLSGGLRFLLAAALLAGFLAVRHGPGVLRVPRRHLVSAGVIGLLLLTGGNGMVTLAEQHISSGLAALLVASVPLWLVIFRTVTGDRPPVATLAGVIAGFLGVAFLSVLGGDGTGSAAGMVIVLLAALSWSAGSFLAGRLAMPANTFVASVYEMAAGGVALLLLGLVRGESIQVSQISGRSWLALAYLVTFGSLLAFTSYAWLLGNAPLTLVGTYAYVNPAVAVLLGALFLSESVNWQTLLGGAIIIVGVGVVVSTERRPKPVSPPTLNGVNAGPDRRVLAE